MKSVILLVILIISFLVKGEQRKSIYFRGVSDAERTLILQEHNDIRLQIAHGQVPGQPKASNMKRMGWDQCLANAAQRIAETCVFAHVKVHDQRFSVGQNIYWSASNVHDKTADWPSAINAWFVEHKNYNFGNKTYNHYTQEVWANSTLIGCGFHCFTKRPHIHEKLYVCNYAPAGNCVGHHPYETGPGCENLC